MYSLGSGSSLQEEEMYTVNIASRREKKVSKCTQGEYTEDEQTLYLGVNAYILEWLFCIP